jgi:RNA polymerase sigma factor (sigma-70 family)
MIATCDHSRGDRPVAPSGAELETEIADAVGLVRAGNAQAYAAIVTRFQGPILTLCAAILRDRQAAEELAQDVFVRAYERLDLFDARQPMKPWLVKIAYRLAQQKWRAEARETARRRAAASVAAQTDRDKGPPESLLAAERSHQLWQTVHTLPMAERTAVVLYYRENLAVNDVAAVMGVSPGTVKTHLFRARSQIQVKLRAKGFDEADIS